MSEVREIKMGTILKGSKATKRGIKGNRIFAEINSLKILISQLIKIKYKKESNWARHSFDR